MTTVAYNERPEIRFFGLHPGQGVRAKNIRDLTSQREYRDSHQQAPDRPEIQRRGPRMSYDIADHGIRISV